MRDKNKINMPCRESNEYVSRLVSDATERAISNSRTAKFLPVKRLAAVAATVLVIIVAGTTCYKLMADSKPLIVQTETSPVDKFLNGLTDEEVQMLSYYEVEEITLVEY